MPMNPDAVGAGQMLASEGEAIQQAIERRSQQLQTIAASADQVAPVPERFRQAARAARQRLQAAEAAVMLAEQQTRMRIRMDRADEEQAQRWLKDALLKPGNEVKDAKAALAAAELALGQQVQYQREYEALASTLEARIAERRRQCQQDIDTLEREVFIAGARCADA